MKPQTIGIIGAQGHLGQSLCKRLQRLYGSEVTLVPSVDKASNKAIAAQSDVILITVRPEQMDDLLREIAPHLKPNAVVISFAAHYPLASIIQVVQRRSARVIGDIKWNLCGYLCGGDMSSEEFNSFFDSLTKTRPLELHSDAEFDQYAILLVHVIVVLHLEKLQRIENADEHLEFAAKGLSRFGRKFQASEFRHFELGDDSEAALKELATPGGITEKTLEALRGTSKPAEVHQKVIG
ncbi:MAG: hypothetical protein A3F42_05835 [Gammaproteobacteria bacterium RIFCSPHIGHO2_12_FULL_37_34]|nr:MAG: hypothetical protein A3F42_05835 [Gammaproteobacteria bacterium RIFCSPHIGHO2_12_FULL_37_34]